MAYKLTTEQKEVANFIRGLNKNIENAYKSFGKGSEIYQNLVAFANIHGLTSSKSNFEFYQASSSKSVLDSVNIKEIKKDYYAKDNSIKSLYNTAKYKAISSKSIKKGTAKTYKEAYEINYNSTIVVELYKETMQGDVPSNVYDDMCDIMQRMRNDNLTADDIATMKKYSETVFSRVGDVYYDNEGNVVYDMTPDDEYIDPI